MTTIALRSIVVEKVLPHSREKIWRALTDPVLIERWLMRNDFAPVVGHRFNFHAKPVMGWNGVTDCEVLEVTPPSRLVYRWDASGEQAATGLKSTITWTLVPVDGGTRVRMEHSGFRPEDEGGYRAMGGGWPRIVDRLGELAGELA
ncbi:MAG TPA: SRPBCC domain-containing protein [Steroidobacteraceae bacterium]|nr:SRPBCC domain-containing protein [Steroidobacteraceae bacterium]